MCAACAALAVGALTVGMMAGPLAGQSVAVPVAAGNCGAPGTASAASARHATDTWAASNTSEASDTSDTSDTSGAPETPGAPDSSHTPEAGVAHDATAPGSRCAVRGVHADVVSLFVDGGDTPRLALDSRIDDAYPGAAPGARYDADTVVYVLDDAARHDSATLPESYGWLASASSGGAFWLIPQTQEPDVLWAGMSTEPLADSPHADRSAAVTMTLDGLDGPGDVLMWTQDASGVVARVLGSADGWPRSHAMTVPQHEHMNWAFTSPGRYVLSMSANATIDGQVQTARRDYVFAVGPASPSSDDDAAKPTPDTPSDMQPGKPSPKPAPSPEPKTEPKPAPGTPAPAPAPNPSDAHRPADAAPAPQQCVFHPDLILDQGHVDFAAFSSTSNPFRLVVQEDTTGGHVRWSPNSVMLWLKPESRTARGWSVPQTQNPALLWLGWNSQHLADRTAAVTWTLDEFEGPGSMRVWLQGNLGEAGRTVLASDGARSFTIPANSHAHANWDFSAEGYYRFRSTYRSALGQDSAWIYLTVGDLDPSAMPIPCGSQGVPGGVDGAAPAAPVRADSANRTPGGAGGAPGARRPGGGLDPAALGASGGESSQGLGTGNDGRRATGVEAASKRAAHAVAGLFARHPLLAAVMFVALGVGLTALAAVGSAVMRRERETVR